jgi:hypothetical protein
MRAGKRVKKLPIFLAVVLLIFTLRPGSSEQFTSLAQEKPAAESPENKAPMTVEVLLKSLPADNFAEGWVHKEKPRLYSKEDLYELIDGEAEMYFQYGFINVASGIYTNRKEADSLLTVDLYQMADKLMAFGVYSTYRSSDSSYKTIGTEAFGDPGYLYSYQGKFFVRIYCASLKTLKNPVLAAARSLLASLPGDHSPPPELSLLPGENMVAHSEKVTMKGFLGIDDHPQVLEADYRVKGNTFKGFMMQSPDEKKNQALFSKLSGLMEKNSLEKKPVARGTALCGRTKYNKGLCLCATGNSIMGACMLESFDEGLHFITRIKVKESDGKTQERNTLPWYQALP